MCRNFTNIITSFCSCLFTLYEGVLIILLLIEILLTYKKNFQVKINGQNEEMLRAAIEQFGDKTDDEIAFGNIFSV